MIPFEERLKIVNSIKFVDKAIPENDANKLKAWDDIRFDIIFKGSDWKGSEKWNNYEKEFNKLNVEVKYFDYTEGTSSTKLRDVLAKII